ncbi:hypothetical protein AVME950_23860 [Acidovorax sp. SUPP950]|uniref:hypothetical protein n=1 Tax=Acidovorax sp. SUPP950 TaxID=511901 RepID=UPI0023BB43E4|nr:hypothetical protein [Acidovorax sp. SUPP950]GKS77990.1 hypothetical protein AVME950_23860 [Acidovorax sp. SUPP950]
MKVRLREGVNVQENGLNGWIFAEKIYPVISIEQYSSEEIGFRVVSEDSEQPVVFKASFFDIVDNIFPVNWRILAVQFGFVHLGPEEFGRPFFWEHYFDKDPEVLSLYRKAIAEMVY